MKKSPNGYKDFVDSPAPYEVWDKLPAWTKQLTPFQRMLILRCMRTDRRPPTEHRAPRVFVGRIAG